ncbi:MAG: PAS domain-containing sensor histidine kinase [Deltaproteobacteria bacterium]|nr:PAS domain-containing sensor histidine kinase [Deltaproteobacteria bacterium]
MTVEKHKTSGDLTFYRFIIDSLPVGVLTVSPQMKVTSFNPWAERLTGYSVDEALGNYCGDILQGEMCGSNCPLKTAIDQKQSIVRIETMVQNKSGDTIPVRMHTAALLDSSGNLIGAVEAFQDISPLKTAEREKDNLISMFAHDMKASLTIIGGFVLRLLKTTMYQNEKKRTTYLGIIRRETDKLDALVHDFLEFSRLQSGELKLNFQAVSLDKELMEINEIYQSKAIQSGIQIALRNDDVLPVIMGDSVRLRRVFANLLDNAFKFSRKDTTITIATKETAEEIMIIIQDQGSGIDPEDLPYIFDIFHRGKGTNEIEGTGVGLASVKAIIEGHGGRVLVESNPGRGSAFTVILPKHAKKDSERLEYKKKSDEYCFLGP